MPGRDSGLIEPLGEATPRRPLMLKYMLDWYDMTEEERSIRDLAREVAEKEIAPRAERHDLEGTFVRDSIEALAEAGLLGANVPKEYGGLGGTPLAAVMVLEAVSAACGSTGASYLFHLNLVNLIKKSGPEELRQKYLPGLAKEKLGSFAINEGRPLFREPFETLIEEKDDHYVVNGRKPFSTSAGEADVTVIQVQWPGPPNPFPVHDQDFILVEKGMPGYSAKVLDPMGLRGASNGSIILENVKVPKENVLGEEQGERGVRMLRAVMVKGTSALGPNVPATGIAAAALQEALAQGHKHGVEPWQVHILAEMGDQLSALRTYNYYTARLQESSPGGLDEEMGSAHIEIQRLGGVLPYWICDRAMEVMGGSSFLRSSPVQRYYRDARGCAYLAFPMADRRELVAERLLGHEIMAQDRQTRSMEWDPYAGYAIQFIQALIAKMPEHIAARFKGLTPFEEFARENGSDRVTLSLYTEFVNSKLDELRAAGFGPEGSSGAGPGVPPQDSAPVTAPTGGGPGGGQD
jgi:butyryl-CoA dehydrogenase